MRKFKECFTQAFTASVCVMRSVFFAKMYGVMTKGTNNATPLLLSHLSLAKSIYVIKSPRVSLSLYFYHS